MNINTARIETELTSLLEEFVTRFRLRERASITISQDEQEGTDFRVEPFEDAFARFWGNYVNNVQWINVYIAENTMLEVPVGGRQYTDKEGIEELTGILEAVVKGGIEEEVWKHHDEVVKSVGTMHVDGEAKPTVITCYDTHNPFSAKTKSTKRYLPYV